MRLRRQVAMDLRNRVLVEVAVVTSSDKPAVEAESWVGVEMGMVAEENNNASEVVVN